jgi:DNA-binding GntR family transcriptional regulator
LRDSQLSVAERARSGQEIGSGPYTPLAHVVTEELRSAIFEGRLPPGAPIRQEAVARELGTSRIPVREALRQLEGEGLVTIVPHSGARVAKLDYEECLDIYRIRDRIEPLAFGDTVGRLSSDQLATLVGLCDEIEENRDGRAWIDVDRRFHLGCYTGASPRLARMISSFWNATQKYRRILQQTLSDADYDAYHHEHRLMIDALEAGNVSAGEALVRMHIGRSLTLLSDHRELFEQ